MPLTRKQLLIVLAVGVTAVTVVALTTVGLVCAYIFMLPKVDSFDGEPFDHAKWAAATSTERQPMVRDVMRRVISNGMTEAEVVEQLGKPDTYCDSCDFRHEFPKARKTYWYYVGSASFAGFDSAYLYVHFDASGRVMATDIGGG
jgi:hypothetical protein